MARKIRVLVVDDSALMRQMVSRILRDAGFEVVGTARDGQQALEAAERLKPDVITLDVEMPVMDGLTMLRRLMQENPLPVVMLSSLTTQQAPATIEALALGAVDVVAKPGGAISLNIDEVAEELISKVRVAATARVRPSGRAKPRRAPSVRSTSPHLSPNEASAHPAARCRRQLNRRAQGACGACFQLAGGFRGSHGHCAAHACRVYRVACRSIGQEQQLGCSRSQGRRHPQGRRSVGGSGRIPLRFDRRGRMQFDLSEPHLGVRPAVDLTMESAVDVWGSGVIGVVLTGMGMDGARGARRIKQAGGIVFAQDEASSVVFGMPRAVIEMGHADHVVPLSEMAELLDQTVRRRAQRRFDYRLRKRGRGRYDAVSDRSPG